MTKKDFETRVAAGEFLEHATVHGNHYGTLNESVLESIKAGTDVLLDIDVQGAAMIRTTTHETISNAIADVFLMPASMEELERRLRKRGTETQEQLQVRLGNAKAEMQARREYRYTIISGTPEEDFKNFRAIMQAERLYSRRLEME